MGEKTKGFNSLRLPSEHSEVAVGEKAKKKIRELEVPLFSMTGDIV